MELVSHWASHIFLSTVLISLFSSTLSDFGYFQRNVILKWTFSPGFHLSHFGKIYFYQKSLPQCSLNDLQRDNRNYKNGSRLPDNVSHRIWKAGIFLFKVNNGNTKSVSNLSKAKNKDIKTTSDVFLVSLLLTLNSFCTLFWCFHGQILVRTCWGKILSVKVTELTRSESVVLKLCKNFKSEASLCSLNSISAETFN